MELLFFTTVSLVLAMTTGLSLYRRGTRPW